MQCRHFPKQLRSILKAKVSSFDFNSYSKHLSITASLNQFTLVSGFLSISDVQISYDGTLGSKVVTRGIDFSGIWQIGDYAIQTRVVYNGASKQITITSQSEGGKDLSIENVVQSLAGTTVPLPSAISSFTFNGFSGIRVPGITVVVFSGSIGNGIISVVFQKSSSALAGAVVVNIEKFRLSELIESATGRDISNIPYFGTVVIPKIGFAAATEDIMSPFLARLGRASAGLGEYIRGIVKGVSGQFVLQIGDVKILQ